MTEVSLPAAFRDQIITMLGEHEGEAFFHSYTTKRTYGLRLNQLKIPPSSKAEQTIQQLFDLRPVSWCTGGYYYDEHFRPGKHPYHAAGLYYIQEPSAMSAVELLAPKPGEVVLDLAAAPGGKTTQIAAKMAGSGLLISNEIHPQRAKILAENVERLGIRNAVVTQATPGELSSRFPLAFDRIMLDAPCSGEGMFRKDHDAISEWSPASVEVCVNRQWDILQDAVAMLKPGGVMAYSTCTFNRRENEEMMSRLLNEYPFLRLVQEKRIWPHLQEGEGHYVALIERLTSSDDILNDSSANSPRDRSSRHSRRTGRNDRSSRETKDVSSSWKTFLAWAQEELPGFKAPAGTPILFGEALYLLPHSESYSLNMDQLSGLKIPRAGLHLGDFRKDRFHPAHALAMASAAQDAACVRNLEADSPEVTSYLHGDTLTIPDSIRGWCLVTITCGEDHFPLGWGKASNGQLKNHLPKGLRN
ncbi:NOL1/NOP2/sun family putative RNA methylase [Fontibacillus solani]|uniref:NOL1/NOP2/sun family putative RNA methylase n=1 Tax=Fontibacillus solani TaxID=1572857 RepID=A0A7W3SU99_9BACL|nr:RsmB/NOP family class I SAM-dependent RNA methyltransferase [Fontibacillus solani]MBA9086352.1 NOL1/NOP2/sun family putative RNA methylase [Fontibacillus solani]